MEEIVIREAKTEDRAFIIHSWLTSFYGQSYFTKAIPKDLYFKMHRGVITRLLGRETSETIMAVSREDEDVIAGFLVTEVVMDYRVAHYVYVKRAFNGLGICRLLFESREKMEYTTHVTTAGKTICKALGLKYCPYLLFL